MRNASHEVASAVERIDNPDVLGIIRPCPSTLFADESVVWVGALKVVDQLAFGGQVDLGDKVSFAFCLETQTAEVIRRPNNQVACFSCCAERDVDHWFHDCVRAFVGARS